MYDWWRSRLLRGYQRRGGYVPEGRIDCSLGEVRDGPHGTYA
jgi:hypothetical protein